MIRSLSRTSMYSPDEFVELHYLCRGFETNQLHQHPNGPLLTHLDVGAPGGIRTPDHLVRSQVLYPAELQAHDVSIKI